MKPSKEAIEAAYSAQVFEDSVACGLVAAYAIDVQPMEQRVKELEEELKKWKMTFHNSNPEKAIGYWRMERDELKEQMACYTALEPEIQRGLLQVGQKLVDQGKRIAELEAENQRLKALVDSAHEIVNELIQYDGTTELVPEARAWKAQLERKATPPPA